MCIRDSSATDLDTSDTALYLVVAAVAVGRVFVEIFRCVRFLVVCFLHKTNLNPQKIRVFAEILV